MSFRHGVSSSLPKNISEKRTDNRGQAADKGIAEVKSAIENIRDDYKIMDGGDTID